MIAGRVLNATRVLGAPADWRDTDPPCGALPIRDEALGGRPAMVSAWLPTPEEIAEIVAGAPVHLVVFGSLHPPCAIGVGERP